MNWTGKKLNQLQDLFKKYTARECALIMGIPLNQVKAAIGNHGLRAGRSGKFCSGDKRLMVHPKGVRLSPDTEFKKGHKPWHTVDVGTMSLRKDGNNSMRWFIKTPEKWITYQRWWWEQNVGPVERGSVVVLIDRDADNLSPDNFKKLTRSELVRFNENRLKMAESLRVIYRRERVRKLYDLEPLTGHGKRLVNY